jgi:hypothetical protein
MNIDESIHPKLNAYISRESLRPGSDGILAGRI